MSNSSLVSYTRLSPNCNKPRNHVIDTVTIHCAVGQCSVETLGAIFAPKSRGASSNYGIGADGRIGMYCEEANRSWCSSSASNDNRAVTIECACDLTPPYAINDKVYKSLVNLCADICRRNDIKELKWKGDKSLVGQVDKQNMTVHRWFANKSCPGDDIYGKLGRIAADVNAIIMLSAPVVPVNPVDPLADKTDEQLADEVIAGKYGNGDARKKALGSRYDAVQVIVSQKMKKPVSQPAPKLKSVDEVAREVIRGSWGNGADRINRLKKAGYNPSEVQKRVNALSKKK